MKDQDNLKSFDASHLLQRPPRKRAPYSQEQKDRAVELLNEGALQARKIANLNGPGCSPSNPYRWRAEQREEEQRRQQAEVARAQQEVEQHIAAAAPAAAAVHRGRVQTILEGLVLVIGTLDVIMLTYLVIKIFAKLFA